MHCMLAFHGSGAPVMEFRNMEDLRNFGGIRDFICVRKIGNFREIDGLRLIDDYGCNRQWLHARDNLE